MTLDPIVEAKVAFVVIDGLPLDLAERVLPELPFVGSRLPHHGSAVSCFPSTTGPAYFPLLAGCTPGRANVPGIRWFDRTRPTKTDFPHRGLRRSSAPLPPGPLRTLDLFPYALEQAGVPLDEYPASDAALLAAGTWAPGVI